MQGRPIPGKRSSKKKKSVRFQKLINFTFLVTTFFVFIFMMSAFVNNLIVYNQIRCSRNVLKNTIEMSLEIQKEVDYTKTSDFIEHYARENLDMLKSGEFIIILKGN